MIANLLKPISDDSDYCYLRISSRRPSTPNTIDVRIMYVSNQLSYLPVEAKMEPENKFRFNELVTTLKCGILLYIGTLFAQGQTSDI